MATSATMATAMLSLGLNISPLSQSRFSTCRANLTLSLLPLTRNQVSSLNLSSSRCISAFSPLVPKKSSVLPSPVQRNPQSFTVVCAKGYKMKTHKASAKRFRVTGSGKIIRRRAGKQHLLRKKNAKRRSRLSKTVQVDRSDYNNVIGALPYLKVNRSN